MRHFPQNNLHEWVRLALLVRFRDFCVFLYLPKLPLMVRTRQMIPSVWISQTPWQPIVFWTNLLSRRGPVQPSDNRNKWGLKCCVL